ncbi:MAG: hypothetical protein NVSMB64_09750 [Candidatus Velthaea sp.]
MFTCGCTAQAGTTTTAADGSYTIVQSTTAIPATPNPTYTTVPGRNYVEVITASAGAQTWTMNFLGKSAATNAALASGPTDQYTTAVSLYAYYYGNNSTSADTSFDQWSFPSLQSFYTKLKSNPNAQETKLLADILTSQTQNKALYPDSPKWQPALPPNGTIANDLIAVKNSADTSLPQACSSPSDTACPGLTP